ncbi:peptidase inhibitor family I36 protein [Actinoplanes bogorensis]|uniref:Peptidase inhibitor family I36 protein n=1 Tax=Paractinoplanes bogorensis TaxID=1610840 RepID=A0ABS5YXD1_9ACTN|nr:peptidase inhibitor family I36 protein [Actinoplanes bogorensis]MBU2668097.1 peptidase inhibitor family I36 protein [Actinoplanes bogorensis]
MRALLRRAGAVGAGVILMMTALAGPASAAEGPSAATAREMAAAKAANGGRAIVPVDNMLAAGGLEACDSGSFCVWVNANFNDGPGQWPNNSNNYLSWSHASCGYLNLRTWNNCASSVFNNGNNCNIQLYDDVNYGTGRGYYNLARGGRLANLTIDKMSDGQPMNDRLSSHKWCSW